MPTATARHSTGVVSPMLVLTAATFLGACDTTDVNPVAPTVPEAASASGTVAGGGTFTAQGRPVRQTISEQGSSGFSGTCTVQRSSRGDLVVKADLEGPPNGWFYFGFSGPVRSMEFIQVLNSRGSYRISRRVFDGADWPSAGMASCTLHDQLQTTLLAATGDFQLP